LNGGDIKAVQGDSGHAQAQMVTDQYSHILDDDRKNNAVLIEKAFYSGKGSESVSESASSTITLENSAGASSGINAELLTKLLTNPEMATLLAALAQNLK